MPSNLRTTPDGRPARVALRRALVIAAVLSLAGIVGVSAASATSRAGSAQPNVTFVTPSTDTTTTTTTTTRPGATTTTTTTTLPGGLHPTTTEQKLVVAYYESLFGRLPNPAELTAGVTALDLHHLDPFVTRLLTSSEFRSDWVNLQFQRYLGRSAGSGSGYYVGWLANGRTYDQVIASIVSSGEFVAGTTTAPCRATTGCPTSLWLNRAYLAITGITIDGKTQLRYQHDLAAGVTRYQVAASILTSAAGRSAYVTRIFLQYTHHAPTTYERFLFVTSLLSGTPATTVERQLLESADFTNTPVIPAS